MGPDTSRKDGSLWGSQGRENQIELGAARVSAGGVAALVIAASACLGSIPFGLIVTRLASGTDVRRAGSGNIGATNVLRVSGPVPALLTLLLDAGKGAVAVLLAFGVSRMDGAPAADSVDGPKGAGMTIPLAGWAALAAVAGHILSPWLGFRGGKGVATAAGALLALSPVFAALALGLFAVILLVTRIVSLSSIVTCLSMPVIAAARVLPNTPPVPIVLGICALIVFRHRANIVRLIHGEEPRLMLRSRAAGDGR